jgi:triacylglycerol lipase
VHRAIRRTQRAVSRALGQARREVGVGVSRSVRQAREVLRGALDAGTYLLHWPRFDRAHLGSEGHPLADRPPVLVVHGFMGTRGAMYPLEQRLWHDGFTVFSRSLGLLNTGDVRRSASVIASFVESILMRTGVRHVDVVAHSMGGLIALYYVKFLGGAGAVRKLVSMGTPYQGTWAGLLGVAALGGLSRGTWQMLPGSRLIAELQQGHLPTGPRYYNIRARGDAVCPFERSRLPGSKEIVVPLGHASLVMSRDVYRRIRDALLE